MATPAIELGRPDRTPLHLVPNIKPVSGIAETPILLNDDKTLGENGHLPSTGTVIDLEESRRKSWELVLTGGGFVVIPDQVEFVSPRKHLESQLENGEHLALETGDARIDNTEAGRENLPRIGVTYSSSETLYEDRWD
jgi:hypothetical protein